MGSGEGAIVALSTMISLKVTFSDGLGGAMVVLFVLAVFVLSIMLDKVRIFSWNKLSNKVFYAE